MNDFNMGNKPNPNGTGNTPPQYGNAYKATGSNTSWQPPQQNSGTWQQAQNYSQNYNSGAQQAQHDEYKWNFADYENSGGKPPKKKNKGLIVFVGIVCSMLAIAVIGFAGYGVYNIIDNKMVEQLAPSSQAPEPPQSPELNISNLPSTEAPEVTANGVLTTKQIAAKVQPSVVGIVAYLPAVQGNTLYGFSNGSTMQMSEGSGIIMSSDGYIITNAHVVEGATGMKVVLNNNEEYEAHLVGIDSSTDLAVINISAKNLTPAEFGDSTKLMVGEDVVAIGNPGGLEFANSLTKGVVSGINRPMKRADGTAASYTMNCIQTDAAINPGNSGGALVNEYGQVVGINSSKISATSYEGWGFAIPINEAKPIVDDLIANGHVTGRVKLGITGMAIDEMTARYNNVPMGFLVQSTDINSDIATKGILPGDIITKIDGKEIYSLSVIAEHLRSFKAGDRVTITVFRRTSGKQDTTFEVTVAVMEDSGKNIKREPEKSEQEQPNGNFFSFLG
ncbi:MAG: trypsin-like peptidase domain-containing protein [Hydrogenoanaerobacterium sp.]